MAAFCRPLIAAGSTRSMPLDRGASAVLISLLHPGTDHLRRDLGLLLDALKATGPVLLAERYFAADPRKPWIVVAVAAAAFVGHLWPVFARFQGGKGVATALGCFVAIAPLPALCGALTWVVLFGVTRISSVGSLGAVVLFPVWLYLLHAEPPVYALTALFLSLILWRHRGNIARLWSRTEQRL